MRRPVDRSQSLRLEPRTESPGSSSSLRPKVSFNRAVHIKRISRRLADVLEDEDSPDYSDVRTRSPMAGTNGYSTLPTRRGGNVRNGVKKSSDSVTPSDRLSRLIRHDPKSDDERKMEPAEKPKEKKKSLSERVRGMFTPKRNASRKQEKKTEDDLKARYTEFKGQNNSSSDATDNETDHRFNSKRRGSAPETRSSWFRSIDRLKKPERYFGESDRRMDSSADSEMEGMTRAPSLVYLHSAAVGDIPHRAVSPSRRLSRSVSVLAPWAPTRTRPPRAPTRTRATQTDETRATLIRPPPRQQQQQNNRSLPKLVFTGPSIEETVVRPTLSRSNTQMRGRK